MSYHQTADWPNFDNEVRFACIARLFPGAKGQDLLFQVLSAEKWKQRNLTVSLYGSGRMEGTLKRLAAM